MVIKPSYMPYTDLREFIRALEEKGELKRIPFEVDPVLEITEFADRAVKRGGPALLFEKPKGSSVPVLINAFASMRRMEIALEVASVDEVARRISEFLEVRMPQGLIGKLKMLPKLVKLSGSLPRTVKSGPCREVVREGEKASLAELPILKCWPEDGGRFITLPIVITKDPHTGIRNVGMYRMHVYDERTTGMHWHAHKVGQFSNRHKLRDLHMHLVTIALFLQAQLFLFALLLTFLPNRCTGADRIIDHFGESLANRLRNLHFIHLGVSRLLASLRLGFCFLFP